MKRNGGGSLFSGCSHAVLRQVTFLYRFVLVSFVFLADFQAADFAAVALVFPGAGEDGFWQAR